MYIDEHEVSQYDPNAWIIFLFDQVEKCRHKVTDCIMMRWDMPSIADKNLIIAITS